MKIAFFGLKQAIDYFQIGGTESFVRRLTFQIVQEGNYVDYILYGDKENRVLRPVARLSLRYFKSFDDALAGINGEYDHVIVIYLLPKDRLKYVFFRGKNSKVTKFHLIYFSYPNLLLKRNLYFAEARLFPYNGRLFCISKRLYEYVSRYADNAVYLLPPIPEKFFVNPGKKPAHNRIKVTFLGRIDPGKGINEVIEIFKGLKDDGRLECSIYGIHIRDHKESLNIHNWLKSQKEIEYIEVEREKYSPAVEEFVRNILRETDIFIQPYKKLSSTIDTPVLLLEAMASLCVVITKPFGNIPDIYGESRFLVPKKDVSSQVIGLLENVSLDEIIKERERIYEQNLKLNFKSESIAKIFLESLKS